MSSPAPRGSYDHPRSTTTTTTAFYSTTRYYFFFLFSFLFRLIFAEVWMIGRLTTIICGGGCRSMDKEDGG